VAIGYTPYWLIYGLHFLMPTKYVLPSIDGDHKDAKPTIVLTSKVIKLEKLQENKLEAQNNVGANQWNRFMWSQQKNIKKKFQFGDYILWFPKGKNTHLGKFKKKWFGPFKVQYCLPHNTIIFVSINNFEPNPILVNVNKLKPYKYMDQTLKGVQNPNNQAFIEL
jgi:hypothetical protein